jgi:hypothetical protein
MTNPIFDMVGARKVRVSKLGVRLFNACWPCSQLRSTRSYWFEFDSNDDIVDTDVPESDDGLGAAALSSDAFEWMNTGKMPTWSE